MAPRTVHPPSAQLWELAEAQHGVVARRQLLALGLTAEAVKHRIARGRLHPLARGIYVVGRPQISREGRWMAAVLSCGPEAALSHRSAAALWAIHKECPGRVEISVPACVVRRRPGIVLHRRRALTADDLTTHKGIPVTTPVCTLVDLAVSMPRRELEAAIVEADKRDLANPEQLRAAIGERVGCHGVAKLRETLDRRTFRLTDSELERRFLLIVRGAGLPETGRRVTGFKVDFYWPETGLIVETDGLRYHRTPVQQATDRRRDQVHTAAGRTPLRFTHAQIRYQPEHVRAILSAVARRVKTLGR